MTSAPPHTPTQIENFCTSQEPPCDETWEDFQDQSGETWKAAQRSRFIPPKCSKGYLFGDASPVT